MKLSQLSETLIGSEIVKLGGEIREKIRQGERIYNFTVGDFDPSIFPIPKELEEEIIAAYRHHFTNYPAAEGNLDLRESIAAFIAKREGITYDTSSILVAAGGRPLIYSAYRAICDEGDKVIYAVPSWNNNHYSHFVKAEHVVIDTTPENKFMPAPEDIRPHMRGASLITLCSPQNPTGTTISREALDGLCRMILEENASRSANEKKLYLLYDQMYWNLTFGDIVHYDPVSLHPAMKEFTVFIDAISKVFAATGVRVGWSMGPERIIAKMKAILTHVGAWAPMAEQKAVARYLTQEENVNRYLSGFRAAVWERLSRIYRGFMQLKTEGFPVDAIAPEGAIYLTIKIELVGGHTAGGRTIETQGEVTQYLLDEAKLAIVPFYAFGAPKSSPWYRLSVGTCQLAEIDDMLAQLRQALYQVKRTLQVAP